jgi:hypothetical protein
MPAVLALAAVLALWIDLSPIHRFHNSDSLIPILMSLDRWAPFYWEQNRFGMLLPLIAAPFQDPFANLLAQVGLRLLALVLSFFLLARTVVPRPWWPAVGALTFGLFVLGKDLPQQSFFQMQPYFQAMALALSGVLLLEGGGNWKKAAGAALLGLAFWVAPVALFWLVPLLVLRRVLGLGPPPAQDVKDNKDIQGRWMSLLSLELLLPVGLAGLAFAGSLLASRLSDYHRATNLGLAPPADWPRAWLALAEKGAAFLGPGMLIGLGLLLLAALGRRLFTPLPLAGEGTGVRAGLCLLGTAAVELLVLGTSGWVHENAFRVRFLSTVLLMAATAGPALLLGLLLERRPARWGRAANILVLAALLPLALWRFGFPSPAAARAALAAGPGAGEARVIVADGCTHVLGDYWRVWPAVFQARVLLRAEGEERKVWGIGFRSTPTWDLWRQRDWHRARIAAVGSPRRIETVRVFYRIPPFGAPRGPARCAAPPVVSFRGFRGSP